MGTDAQKATAQEVAIGRRWTARRPQVRQRQYKARNYVKDHDSQMAGVEDTHEHQAKGATVGLQRDNRPEVKEKDPSHCYHPQHLELREPLERTLVRRCPLVHACIRAPTGSREAFVQSIVAVVARTISERSLTSFALMPRRAPGSA